MGGLDLRIQLPLGGFSLEVELAMPARGVTALFGPSGSGKTTLLRCIAGLERFSSGRIAFDDEIWQDREIWIPPHKRPIGYVFQEASLFPHLSALDNLRYGMKRNPGARRADLDQAIELLGIGSLLGRKPEQLSGGERQRVGIARALAVGPRVLLMDEPLSALDSKLKREILPYLEGLREHLEIPIVYVSHSVEEVARLADHLVLLEDGKAVASGPLSETLSRIDLPSRIGGDAGSILTGTIGEVDRNWQLARLDFEGGSLWMRDRGVETGRRVRAFVPARDVSLATVPGTTSIQNVLPGIVEQIGDDEHPALVLVRVRVGRDILLSRLTRRSASILGIAVGRELWVQVKSVALME